MLDPSHVYRPEACFDEYNEFVSRTSKTSCEDFRNYDVCINIITGLKILKKFKSPFGDYQKEKGRQMQKCSRQITDTRNIKLMWK